MQGRVNVPTERILSPLRGGLLVCCGVPACCWLLFEWNIQQHHFLHWKDFQVNIMTYYHISASCSMTSGADGSVLWAQWDHLVSL